MIALPAEPNNMRLPFAEIPQEDTPDAALTALADEVDGDYVRWRTDRQIHELQWFWSAAVVRGAQDMRYSQTGSTNVGGDIEVEVASSKRLRVRFNRLLQNYLARQGKFLKQRWVPIVVPFSPDREDKMNAQATQRAFESFHAREHIERKYRLVLNWTNTCGKAFMRLYWDPRKMARVQLNGLFGKKTYAVEAGDICVEPSSPFEWLVPDPGQSSLHEQDKVMHVKVRLVSDVKALYK